jgi:hypothetical protein
MTKAEDRVKQVRHTHRAFFGIAVSGLIQHSDFGIGH